MSIDEGLIPGIILVILHLDHIDERGGLVIESEILEISGDLVIATVEGGLRCRYCFLDRNRRCTIGKRSCEDGVRHMTIA